MIRQAHTYLVGAMGGATLIAIAIVFFVLLVSAQVFRDWPIAALGDGGGSGAAVSGGEPVGGTPAGDESKTVAGSDADADADKRQRPSTASGDRASSVAGGGDLVTTGSQRSPETGGGSGGGENQGETPAGGGPPQGPTTATPSSDSGSSGGGGSKGGTGGGAATAPSTSGQVTETVNSTVTKVDETALGGTLGDSGVTEATEGIVNGVAGPESAVGQVVDGAVDTVGGVLGGKR